ncbi:protein of unknown function [Nocardioides terrae]|uniref:DnaJ homologue subfamily C member 28 conserved domain-containing protein n=1 Tax=Nocardioides terrae TaxID=574651 RepID=A0A1I1EWT5_9ACTN|nr:DUF1992 domain-containing protein [Nocardioides terrae]SFB89958.1 protein of unknown function [Nocardioides terrae]
MSESEDWPEGRPERPPRPEREGSAAAAARIRQQQTWVDLQVRAAMERGEFDDLPGAGKPIEGLGTEHDPEWWVKKLVERERLVVLPLSVQLRKEDASLDGELDRLSTEKAVRAKVEDFNERVIKARYALPEGPPLITMPRDVDATVTGWAARRAERLAARRTTHEETPPRRWWRRR